MTKVGLEVRHRALQYTVMDVPGRTAALRLDVEFALAAPLDGPDAPLERERRSYIGCDAEASEQVLWDNARRYWLCDKLMLPTEADAYPPEGAGAPRRGGQSAEGAARLLADGRRDDASRRGPRAGARELLRAQPAVPARNRGGGSARPRRAPRGRPPKRPWPRGGTGSDSPPRGSRPRRVDGAEPEA